MIKAKLSNSKKYSEIHSRFERAFEVLTEIAKNFKVENIEENGVRYLCQVYKTAPVAEKKSEVHRKFIDIQFLASGVEKINFGANGDFEITEPYNDENDAEFLKGPLPETCILNAGEFAIFFPEDAHQPGCIANTEPCEVQKVVVKIPVE